MRWVMEMEELKKRKAGRIFIFSTFGLFTNGMASFDEAYKQGYFDKIIINFEVLENTNVKELIDMNVFSKIILLSSGKIPGIVEKIYDGGAYVSN